MPQQVSGVGDLHSRKVSLVVPSSGDRGAVPSLTRRCRTFPKHVPTKRLGLAFRPGPLRLLGQVRIRAKEPQQARVQVAARAVVAVESRPIQNFPSHALVRGKPDLSQGAPVVASPNYSDSNKIKPVARSSDAGELGGGLGCRRAS